jgi:putative membrane protein
MSHSRCLNMLAGAIALSFVQCGADRSREPATTSTTRMWIEEDEPTDMTPAALVEPRPAASAQPAVEVLSDAQIAAVMSAANEAEIQQARVALRKSKHASVLSFAQMMISDHGAAQKKQQTLMKSSGITPSGSNLLSQLNINAQSAAQVLQTATDADFDRAYMGAQVSAHQQLLDSLDKELIAAAQDPALKALLEEIRPIIDHHLQQAREIQQSLSPSPR